MKNVDIVLATGFVGGLGGVSKIKRTINSLLFKGINPYIVTESNYKKNLEMFGIKPDLVIERSENHIENYKKVIDSLKNLDYKLMVSFGPRTFWPFHALEKGKNAIIVEGGLPPFLGNSETDHFSEVYENLKGFFLTSHFDWSIPDNVISKYKNIPVKVVSHPLDNYSKNFILNLRNSSLDQINEFKKAFFKKYFSDVNYDNKLFLAIRNNYSYLDVNNLESNGGWLKQKEYDESNYFMVSFLSSLSKVNENFLIYLSPQISRKYKSLINNLKNIEIIGKSFIEQQDCMVLSKIVDLNINRAVRCVTEMEIAASGSYGIIVPCPTEYMHEDISADFAQSLGITKTIKFDTPNIASDIFDYINSDDYFESKEKKIKTWDKMYKENNLVDIILKSY